MRCCLNKTTGKITKYIGKDGVVEIPSEIGGVAVKSIGKSAFKSCNTIESVTIPDFVTIIDSDAFSKCSNLKTVYYTGSKEEWLKINNKANTSYFKSAAKVFNYEIPFASGDIDGNGTVDASDASTILAYYTYVQSGNENISFADYLKM